MTTSVKPRGVCPVCGRAMQLTADGTVRHHGGQQRGWPYGRDYRCDGAGQQPKAADHGSCAGCQSCLTDGADIAVDPRDLDTSGEGPAGWPPHIIDAALGGKED